MTSQNNLEIKGSLQTNPLAELLAETFAANLTGSFRLTNDSHKIVIYLNSGEPVFAVSNARQHRLFETLLQGGKITKAQLVEFPNFTNDIELSEALKTKGLISKEEIDAAFSRQIEEILKTALVWTRGEWIFSPLMRIKENVRFKIEVQKLLLEFARNLSPQFIVKRFKSFNETFGAIPDSDSAGVTLLPQEAFLLSRFEKSFLKIEEVKNLSGLSDVVTLQVLYSLWLGGFLFRQNWNPAFTDKKIFEISSAKLSLKKEDEQPVSENEPVQPVQPVQPEAPKVSAQTPGNTQPSVETTQKLSLDRYLERAENSESYYEFFDIAAEAELSDIKRAYFGLAKQFHPDKYYQEKDAELLQRIQNAFTRAAQAYETLKNENSRKAYDYKLSKHLATLKKKTKSDGSASALKKEQAELAKESFDQGFNLLMENEFEEALPFLARAVQMVPDNARYHAFYGKALSSDDSQRFKADSEMQAAVRLDPQNATFRIMLAEFYIQFELFKRAEGELQRLLALHPDNQEARVLLDKVLKK